MGKIDISNATRPTRGRVGGSDKDRANRFRARMPPAAKRNVFIRHAILQAIRTPPVNPEPEGINPVNTSSMPRSEDDAKTWDQSPEFHDRPDAPVRPDR